MLYQLKALMKSKKILLAGLDVKNAHQIANWQAF